MRDYLIVGIISLLVPFIFANPVVGAYLWAWLSVMNPHKLAYGFARQLPFAQIVALLTLVVFLFTRKKYPLPKSGILVVYLLFLAWMTATCFFAMGARDEVLARWFFVMKIHLMLFVTLMLIRDRKHLEWLVWVVTFSVAVFGIKGGTWTLLTGGGGRVWGPPGGMIEGNNELAVALVMLMPYLYYLHQTVASRWVKAALLFSIGTTAFAVLGTQSRGALLALVAMAFFLGLKSRNPIRTSMLLLVCAVLAIGFMPDSWTHRMETINNYQQDGSALTRIWTWQTNWAIAMDRPLVGVGFGAASPAVFARYAPPMIEGYDMSGGRYFFVAHSIYFQTLGEHGFVGCALFLLLGVVTWRTAGKVAKRARNDAELGSWMPLLMHMTQVSLVGYAVGGAFLSLAYLDIPYYIVGYVMLCEVMLRERSAARAAQRPADVLQGDRGDNSPQGRHPAT